jgi:Leucine-rich repeat (LRR) protein
MGKKKKTVRRISTPKDIEAEVLVNSRHMCNICHTHRGQIAHIDDNPSNYDYDNLIVLCPNCHGDVHQKGPIMKGFSPEEILKYKSDWEEVIKKSMQSAAIGESVHASGILNEKEVFFATKEIIENQASENQINDTFIKMLQYLKYQNKTKFNPSIFVQPYLETLSFYEHYIASNTLSKVEKSEILATQYLASILEESAGGMFYLIVSDAGTGKTTLMRYFQNIMVNNNDNPLAALWVDFTTLTEIYNATLHERGLVVEDFFETILNYYQTKVPELNDTSLQKMIADGKVVVLIDALDEIVSKNPQLTTIGSWETILLAFIAKFGNYSVKVIVSCRPTMFLSTSTLFRFKHVTRICPWDRKLMRLWLDLNGLIVNPALAIPSDDILNTIMMIQPLEELCKIPFLLRAFTEIYHELPFNINAIRKHEIYKILVSRRLREKINLIPLELGLDEHILFKIIQIIAVSYFGNKQASIELENIDFNENGKLILSKSELDLIMRIPREILNFHLRNNTILEIEGAGCIFPHRSIPEYLISDLIAHNKVSREKYFHSNYFTFETMELLLESLNPDEWFTIDEIVSFFDTPCQGKTGNLLLKWMEKELKDNYYTTDDMVRIFVEGLANQQEIDLSNLTLFYRSPCERNEDDSSISLLSLLRGNVNITSLNLHNCQINSLPDWIGEFGAITELELSMNNLNTLPESILNLSKLESIVLTNNHFALLPDWIGDILSLKYLIIADNKLVKITDNIGNLTQLQDLFIDKNLLKELPQTIGNLTQLITLVASNNQLFSLPSSIGRLTRLRWLYLEYNRIVEIPNSIGDLLELQELEISDNQLTSIPESIGKLVKLNWFTITDNHLTEIPDTIGDLANLEEFWINENQLTTIPETIGNLSQLQIFSAPDNQLTLLPDSIGELSHLLELYIPNNMVTELPNTIDRLSKLQLLDLSSNQLKNLPDTIGKLCELKELILINNHLKSIPDSIAELVKLEELDLTDNELVSIPKTIGNLSQLQRLIVINNKLASIPQNLGEIKNLRWLYISGNQLKKIPELISKFIFLQKLDISNNNLIEIPDWISNLSQLQELNVSNNRLAMIPDWISNLTFLKTLDVTNNKMIDLPETIGNIPLLQELFISDNHLTILPKSLKNFEHLQTLAAANNRLGDSTEWIIDLPTLIRLDVSGNELMVIPNWINKLNQLRKLDVSNNHLNILPDTIRELIQLQELLINDNNLTMIPDPISSLKMLQGLSLSSNYITELPKWLYLLPLLKLDLSKNQIALIPREISGLSQLRLLNLANNSLISIPNEICNLSHLRGLNVSGNQLKFLPPSIDNLYRLETFEISNNRLKVLPKNIIHLKALQFLDLSNNPFLILTAEQELWLNDLLAIGCIIQK